MEDNEYQSDEMHDNDVQTENQEQSIQPQRINTAQPQEVGNMAFEAPDGLYHLVMIDDDGNEIDGSDFTIPPLGYRNQYANNPNVKIKKNHN